MFDTIGLGSQNVFEATLYTAVVRTQGLAVHTNHLEKKLLFQINSLLQLSLPRVDCQQLLAFPKVASTNENTSRDNDDVFAQILSRSQLETPLFVLGTLQGSFFCSHKTRVNILQNSSNLMPKPIREFQRKILLYSGIGNLERLKKVI